MDPIEYSEEHHDPSIYGDDEDGEQDDEQGDIQEVDLYGIGPLW